MRLALFALLAACAAAPSAAVSVPADVILVVVATEDAPSLHEAQLATFARSFDPASVLKVSELNTSCVLCTESGEAFTHDGLFSGDGNHPFNNKPLGYYCASSRPLQALRIAALAKPAARWVVMVDDDTYVHVAALLRTLDQFDARTPVAIGNPWGGGGGYLISGTALRDNLMAKTPRRSMKWVGGAWVKDTSEAAVGSTVLDACVSAKLGGTMCNAAADWAVHKCMTHAGLAMQRADAQWQQVCETTPPEAANVTCTQHMVTCHKMPADVMRQLHEACVALVSQ